MRYTIFIIYKYNTPYNTPLIETQTLHKTQKQLTTTIKALKLHNKQMHNHPS